MLLHWCVLLPIGLICALLPPIEEASRAKRQFFDPAALRDENAIIFDEYNYFDDSVRIPEDARRPAARDSTRGTTASSSRRPPRPPQGPPTATPVPVPGMGTTQSSCEDRCPSTNQYSPICGDNGVTYANSARYQCALSCGQRVNIVGYWACSRLLPTDPTPGSQPRFFK